MKIIQIRIFLVLLAMIFIPQGMWAQVSTVITQTFDAVTNDVTGGPAISASEGGTWRVTGGASPSYNSGIQITLQHQSNPNAPLHNYYPVYYAQFSPMTGSLNLVIDQIDLYFAAALQNVSIDAANAGFQVSGPTTTSDGIRYQLQSSSSQSASGVFFILTNGSNTSDETIVLKKIVMTGKVTLSAPYLSYSYDSDKAIFSNFTNYNGFLKGYYSIDYASASLADVTNTEYNGTGFGLQGPCTVTAYVQCGTAKSSNEIGTLFGFAESAMTTTYQPNGTVNAPNIVPELPNGATVAYSNNTNGTTAPTNPINSSTGVITINGADTESYSASYLPSPSPSGVTVLNQTNSNGAALSYKLGSFSLTVNKKSLSSDMIQDIQDQTFSGQNITPGITVYDNGVYVPPTEYSYESNNLNAGTGTVKITALASSKKYTGYATKSFNILPRLLTANGTTYSLATDSYVYDGTAKTPAVNITVEKGEPMPVLDTDYTVTYSDNTNVGTGKATITGKGNFTGTVEKSFTITAKSLSGAQFSTIPDQTYTGNEIKPEPTVTLGSATLVKGTDFDFSYSSNTNVPVTANDVPTVTITGKGNFTGTASTTFKIVKATPTVTAPTAKTGLAYTGSAQALVNAGSVTAGTLQYKLGAGGTYGTTIPSATEVGSYAVYYKVVGDANYNDVAEAGPINVTIGKAAGSISYATSSISKTFGDAAFTNALTKTGDGAVSYSSSNTNVATINATSGEVTIVGNGSAVITATVADGTNYTYAAKTATYTLSVGTAAMTVNATGYTGAYDGQAHGITVTAPAGATVKYGTSAGTYNLNASPTYTNAGSYTVYYEVTKANYTTVTGSAVVNISKASASISYATASVGKTFGDAPFTNSLTNTGDGAVTYSSSNTNVATVNATSGEVTIVGNGSTTITATVTDGTNYTYAAKTATYTLSVGTAVMTVSATGYTGAYDGQAHGITVTAPAGATVKYGATAGTYNLNASPTYTNAGTYTVYYQVTKANYTTVTGSQTVTISKAVGAISFASASISKTFGDAPFTNALTKSGDGTVTYSSSSTSVATVNATSGEVTIVGNGSAVITATVADGTNYTYAAKTATYTLSVGTATMTVSATAYTGAYDGQAHGITVSAPDGATVKYGETAGTYNLNASPTYTNAGTYTVYYQVTKANYVTVTGSQTVTISKATGAISFASASISKTFGDAPFTNALTKTGDGAVSYSSSNTNVATINATSGEVTIVGNGSAVITATVADGTNYTYAAKTATYTLSVGTAAMTVSATGYTGAYDGQAHGITVTAPAGATVKYGETAGTYNLNASPTYTNAGTYTVYYQVTKTGFDTVTGSATVTITKVDARVVYVNYEFTAKIGEPFDPPYLTLEPSDLAVTYYSADKDVATVDAQTGEVTLVAPGKVNIYAEFAGDENYNSASDYYILTVLQRDIDPIDEDNTITMSDNDFLTTNDEGQQEEVRLDNTVIYDILYTLNISGDPSESDGYDETEQCVVLNHPVTDREINRIINGGNEPGSEEYADEYTGLTFKVPAGTGYVIIDSRTDGDYQMMVKIGNLAPVAFNHTGREKDSVLYECSVPTWVYVYNGGKVSNARMAVDHRAKKQKGHVKIYSVTRSSAKSSGIERINVDALESERWYDLQGNRIQRPTRKGLYILQGQKVVVK